MGKQHEALFAAKLAGSSGGGGGGGTSDYTDLTNKPKINGVTLVGDKSTADLGISETWTGTAAKYAAEESTIPAETPVIITDTDDIDDTPTQGSANPVTSDGVYTALSGKADSADFVPIAKSAFDDLVSKTAKFYFVYADPASSLQSVSPNLNVSPEPENLLESEEVLTDDSDER
jgi:hypothetical protein